MGKVDPENSGMMLPHPAYPMANQGSLVPNMLEGMCRFESDLYALMDEAAELGVLCVGDVMLDLTVECNPERISQEAPVLVAAQGQASYSLGGAGNVAANLSGLGVRAYLVSACGNDAEGDELLRLLDTGRIAASVIRGIQSTTLKTRFVAKGRQLLRVDRDGMLDGAAEIHQEIVEVLAGWSKPIDVIVISDYGKGLLSAEVIHACKALADRLGVPILVDPKGCDWFRYGQADLIKPNAAELAALVGMSTDTDTAVGDALMKAFEMCGAKAILVTRAAAGASLAMPDGTVRHFPAMAVEVSDVCGAGDTNISAIAVAIAKGWGWSEAITLGQLASAVVVQRSGTVAIDRTSLEAAYTPVGQGSSKLCSRSSIRAKLERWRNAGLIIGFTNGCFDLFHAGHAHILRSARAQCDRLVLGLNSDASIKRIKGLDRPVINQSDRISVLECIEYIDAIVLFDEDNPLYLIEEIVPDKLFKGSDYSKEDVIGRDIVERQGGEVVIIPLLEGRSTTSILARNARLS